MPLVSVILPFFNAASTIRRSIKSICDQTIEDWELIVVDDACTDQSVKIVRSFKDKRIKLIQLKTNSGYPAAMNAGIAQAQGKYIARMDADDVSAPTRLHEQLLALERYPQAAMCGVARYRITPGGKMYADKARQDQYYVTETWDDLVRGKRIFTDPSVMVKKEKVISVGGYRTFQRSGMDVDLWLRMMEKYGPCVTITRPLFGKSLEPTSLIFNPVTNLINQIPRILAKQRVERGTDDIQENRSVNAESYKKLGLITEDTEADKRGLFLGSFVTCLWLYDWKGARVYHRELRRAGNLSHHEILFLVLKKIIERIRRNPYEKYILKA